MTNEVLYPPKYILPDVLGFDKLISGLNGDEIFGPNSTKKAPQPLTSGIPFGATLLISGPPGAGKTTFALELARGLMRNPPLFQTTIKIENDLTPDAQSDEKDDGLLLRKPPLVFYISPEITCDRLQTMFADTGWFDDGPTSLFRVDSAIPDTDNLYTVVPQPEVDRPVPSAEELVNSIFNRISKAISPSEAPREPRPVIVIVDSVTSLLKGCSNESEERRQTHEILHRLRGLFGNDHLAMTILLAEQDFNAHPESEEPSVEDYLAEIVFRLSLTNASLGRRIRSLEVVKSQGVNMILGQHSWAIVTDQNTSAIFRHQRYEFVIRDIAIRLPRSTDGKKQTNKVEVPNKKQKWGTIAIFPRPTLLAKRSEIGTESEKGEKALSSGTLGLDAMLQGNLGYWVRRPGCANHRKNSHESGYTGASICRTFPEKEPPSLKPGSTTLLTGPIGVGKTALCLQFLLNPAEEVFIGEPQWEHFIEPEKRKKFSAVLVTFDRGAEQGAYECWKKWLWERVKDEWIKAFRILPDEAPKGKPDKRKLLKYASEPKPADNGKANEVDESQEGENDAQRLEISLFHYTISVLDFTQSNFDYNTLTAHLEWALRWWQPARIAFDGLSEWQTVFSRQEAAKMLEALLVTVPKYRDPKSKSPTIFLSYELPITDDPLSPQALGVSADNVIVVRQINLHDQIRRIVYILKASESKQDQSIRELQFDSERRRFDVLSGLDVFTDLLRGEPKSAEVLLHLFQENEAESEFNSWMIERLARMRNLKFRLLDFSRFEIASVLEDTASGTRFPPADLKIQSVDEWWLSYERTLNASHLLGTESNDASPLLDLHLLWHPYAGSQWDTLVPTWKDFWVFEVEKAGPEAHEDDSDAPKIYAVPAYTDFGMVCVNIRNICKILGMFPADDYKSPTKGSNLEVLALQLGAKPVEKRLLEYARTCTYSEGARDWSNASLDIDGVICAYHSEFLTRAPTAWCHSDGDWFSGSNERENPTYVDLGRSFLAAMEELKKPRPSSIVPWFFSFDTATRETAVCVFFEFAWAFGADEDFLSTRQPDHAKNIAAAETAIRFLAFLVIEGLMPPHATVETCRDSILSRHYYSTFQSVTDSYASVNETRRAAEGEWSSNEEQYRQGRWARRSAYSLFPLIAIPFFPCGSPETGGSPTEQRKSVVDRFKKLVTRASQCISRHGRLTMLSRVANSLYPLFDKDLEVHTSTLLTAVMEGKGTEEITEAADANTFAGAADNGDIVDLLRRHTMRLRFLGRNAENSSVLPPSLADAIKIDGINEMNLTDGEALPRTVPTGYCCVGSWLYGVHRATRSPSLAYDLLRELTSLEAAEHRAEIGAGLPVRKDFYDLHGTDKVPGMPYFTWNQLRLYCGSKARRRERVCPRKTDPARIYKTIHDEMQACLSLAELRRNEYSRTKPNSHERAQIVTQIAIHAKNAIRRIVHELSVVEPILENKNE